jgi:hypothetical protein
MLPLVVKTVHLAASAKAYTSLKIFNLCIKFTAKPGLRSERSPFFDFSSKDSGTTCEYLVFVEILNFFGIKKNKN